MYGLIFIPLMTCLNFFIHSLGNFFNNLDMWIKGDVEKPLLQTKTGLVLIVILICRKKCCVFSVNNLCDFFFISRAITLNSHQPSQCNTLVPWHSDIYKRLTNACKRLLSCMASFVCIIKIRLLECIAHLCDIYRLKWIKKLLYKLWIYIRCCTV